MAVREEIENKLALLKVGRAVDRGHYREYAEAEWIW